MWVTHEVPSQLNQLPCPPRTPQSVSVRASSCAIRETQPGLLQEPTWWTGHATLSPHEPLGVRALQPVLGLGAEVWFSRIPHPILRGRFSRRFPASRSSEARADC